jgi:glycosyltransferase involved in cell wall biosynthesis
MSDSPLVSVVIPTHFRNEQLREAIRSAQNQTHDNIEIIVVDDSGERHAEPVCVGLDVTYLAHEENQGGNPARNTGIEAAHGEYIQLLDDDDQLAPRKIEKQLELLRSSPSVGVVYCGIEETTGENVFPTPQMRGDVYYDSLRIFQLHPCLTGTMLIDADVLRTIFPLESREAADDIGMKIRLANETQFDYVDEVLYYKGESENHRAQSDAFTDEIVNIIRENWSNIASAPDPVSRDAMKTFYRLRGVQHIRESVWSLDAIRMFWRALQYADGFDPVLIASFISSWFGRPGYRAASGLNQRIRSVLAAR